MRILAATAFALATVATPALAQDAAPSYTGPYVAVIGGLDDVSDDTTGEQGGIYGGVIGFDYQAGRFVIGAEGEANLSSTKQCALDLCTKAGRDLYAGGRVGVTFGGGQSLAYLKAGYTNARATLELNGTEVGSDELDGVRAGAGVETQVGRALVRIEYRYSNYEQDVQRHQGVLGVGFRF